jgi:hypothetical protein
MKTYRFRHWLFFGGVAVIAGSPVAVLVESRWAAWAFMVSIGVMMLSIAAMLVPEKD